MREQWDSDFGFLNLRKTKYGTTWEYNRGKKEYIVWARL